MLQENVNLLNVHHLALFNTEQTHLWLAFWCDFFGAILVVATCLFSVGMSEKLGAPNVGLAISNSIQVSATKPRQCLIKPQQSPGFVHNQQRTCDCLQYKQLPHCSLVNFAWLQSCAAGAGVLHLGGAWRG
jgi:hypothetical protein